MAEILYQGHGSLRLTSDSGYVVYIDPYAGNGYEVKADLILVTHRHFDHCDIDKVCKDEKTLVVYPEALHPNLDSYLSASYGPIKVEAVEAYNQNHDKALCVGYVVEVDGKRVYFSGDTSTTKMMGQLRDIDLAFLPTDGRYNMGVDEAKKAAKLIGAKITVPIHMNPSGLYDEGIAAKFKQPCFMLLRPGNVYKI